MFDNIGSKIKSLATIFCWIGILISVFIGSFLLGNNKNNALLGILLIAIGSLISWIGSFFMYGFGELIAKTSEIAGNTRYSNITNETISNNHDEVESNNPPTTKCPHCGIEYGFDDSECKNANAKEEY